VGPSLSLTVPILAGGTVIGLMLAMLCAAGRGGRLDKAVLVGSTMLMSVNYVVWVLAGQFILAFKLKLFPVWGYENAFYLVLPVIIGIFSGLGVDVGQHTGEEGDIRTDDTFLNQRHYARLSTRYTKPCVIARPVRWGRGFHRIKGHNFHIGKDLFLFHFGYFDLGRIKARFDDPSRRAAGWTKHLERRSKTIRQVTEEKPKDWDRTTRFARILQTVCRPPYALNKPAMFELVLIVRIADRFRNLV
jgi:hypothetical protein